MKYKDCIFDLYGTLVDIHTDETLPRLWKNLSEWYCEHGAEYSADELKSAYFRTVQELERGAGTLRSDAHEAHPEIMIEDVFKRLYTEKGAACEAELAIQTGLLFRKCSLDRICLYDGAAMLLKALRANGQRVWLLSNAQRVFTAYELHALGIDGLFDGVYLSSDYGVKKPDSRFFNILLRERNISPESAIMIGNDSVCDIHGAQSSGISTLYIRSNISPNEPLPNADYVLEEMDLARVLEILTRE